MENYKLKDCFNLVGTKAGENRRVGNKVRKEQKEELKMKRNKADLEKESKDGRVNDTKNERRKSQWRKKKE